METMPIGGVLKKLPENMQNPRGPSRLSNSRNAAMMVEYGLQGVTAKQYWAAARIPKRQADASLRAEPEWMKAYTKCIETVLRKERRGSITVLIGNRGTGKTQIAVETIREGCIALYTARYARALDIFLEVRAAMKSEHQTEIDAIRTYLDPEILVIDEMQERGETAFEDRLLVNILDKRYTSMLDTILIANQAPEQFITAVGASIADRIRETGGIIECTWESFRR